MESRHRPWHGLGSGRIHIDPPSLHNGALENSSGIGSFARSTHRHESEALGPFLIEDDLCIDHNAVLAEENHQVGVPEAKGEIGDVQPATDVNGAPGLLVGEEEVRGTFRSGEEEAFRGRLHGCERRHGRSRHLEGGAVREIGFSEKLPWAMVFSILQPRDAIGLQTLISTFPEQSI